MSAVETITLDDSDAESTQEQRHKPSQQHNQKHVEGLASEPPASVFWTPKQPAQIPTPKKEATTNDDMYRNCHSANAPKPRVAHKPIVVSKTKRPRFPTGQSKKTPLAFRVKYLDVVIDEYLSTGLPEDDCYSRALREEQSIAARAATKNIYINLIAGLKKKIREQSGKLKAVNPESSAGLSHDAILTGRVVGTFSIEKRRISNRDPSELTDRELYEKLKRYLLPKNQLLEYGYPCENPDSPGVALIPSKRDISKQELRSEPAEIYTCSRCAEMYKVTEDRIPIQTTRCIYHPGRLWNERVNKSLERRYSCCKGEPSSGGCNSTKYHVNDGELELENYIGFVQTQPKPSIPANEHGIYALDCEMCYTTLGLELTRITIVDHKFEIVYEKLVKPKNFILDYNSRFSGIHEGDLDCIETTLEDVQSDLLEKFSSDTILVGHSLNSDMKALKLIHATVIDTSNLFPHKRGLPYKRGLKTLVQEYLRVIIQEDAGHDSKEDAISSLKLVFWKLKTDVPKVA